MKIVLFTISLMYCTLTFAAEFKSPPPIDLLLLPIEKVFEGEPENGSHGEKRYCYKVNDIYTVYSENLLGDGYSFSKDAPSKNCITTSRKINTTNNLGLTVGIATENASSLVGVKLTEGKNRIQWYYQRPIHNLPYDDLTTLDIYINNGLVHSVSVFNVVTH